MSLFAKIGGEFSLLCRVSQHQCPRIVEGSFFKFSGDSARMDGLISELDIAQRLMIGAADLAKIAFFLENSSNRLWLN